MAEITLTHIALATGALLLGLVIGWAIRGRRGESEKAAINAEWQQQLAAQRQEHERLLEQNKSLMEQNSQYQASNKDSKMRATELSQALREAFERRDELQRQIKDIRGNLEAAVRKRDQLQSDIEHRTTEVDVTATALKQRDEYIARLTKELENWQDRVPPLVERFRVRNQEASELEEELRHARERIEALEAMLESEETRVEPVDRSALGEDLLASNDPVDAGADMTDQIAPSADDDPTASDDETADTIDRIETVAAAAEEPDEEDLPEDQVQAHSGGFRGGGQFAVAPITSANGFGRDDLKLIKGVGPAIEKTLNEMGIWRFTQIAAMSEYEIDRVAQRLKGFRSRIYREDWIGQARELEEQKASGQD